MVSKIAPVEPLGGPAGRSFLKGREWPMYFFLGLATLVLFARVKGFPFIDYDDYEYVVDNEALRKGFVPQGVAWAFTTLRGGNWHPLTWLSHVLDYQLFGLNAGGHHLINVLLHVVNSLLLLKVIRDLTGAFWRSALVAALFALHPLHVESVVWVSERKDMLGTLFWILAMAAYLRYLRRRSWGRYLLVALAVALGLLSKATVVTLPLVLLLLDLWPLGRRQPGPERASVIDLVKEKVPFLALSVLLAVVTLYAPAALHAMTPLSVVPPGELIGNALISSVKYLALTVWPAGLTVLYPYPRSIPWDRAALSLAVLAALSLLVATRARSQPAIAMGWSWYLLVLLPMVGIVQVGPQAMADRYTYVPLIGIFMAVVWGLPGPAGRRPFRSALLALAVAVALPAFFLVSWRHVGTWRNSITLFQRALEVSEDNFYAHTILAVALDKEGRFEEAFKHLEQALRISPAFALAHSNMGVALERTGRTEEAFAHFREAVRLAPDSAEAQRKLAHAFIRLNRPREAVPHFSRVLELMPESQEAQYNLALALDLSGDEEGALEHYRLALTGEPRDARVRNNIGVILAGRGRLDEAVEHFRAALRLDPQFAEAYSNLEFALRRLGDKAGAAGRGARP